MKIVTCHLLWVISKRKISSCEFVFTNFLDVKATSTGERELTEHLIHTRLCNYLPLLFYNSARYVLFLPLCSWRNWSSEEVSYLPQILQLVWNGAWIEIQVWPQRLHLFPLTRNSHDPTFFKAIHYSLFLPEKDGFYPLVRQSLFPPVVVFSIRKNNPPLSARRAARTSFVPTHTKTTFPASSPFLRMTR